MENDKKSNYLGNPNLKKSNVEVQYTKKQMAEYIKCAEDPIYFFKKYIKIVNVDKGLIKFKPYDFQEGIVDLATSERFVICKMPRQLVRLQLLQLYFFGMFCLTKVIILLSLQTRCNSQERFLEEFSLLMNTYLSGCSRVF